jgi:hypothetical protein
LAELGWLFGRCRGYFCVWSDRLATPGGFEPPISTVTGWHVSPLHHGAYMKSSRALVPCQQTNTLYESVGKPTLKCQEQKCRRFPDFALRRATTTPHKSVGSTQYLAESVNTFCRFASVEMVILSIMSLLRRYCHEDRAGNPWIPCQPNCG